jgi:hypothetical protein
MQGNYRGTFARSKNTSYETGNMMHTCMHFGTERTIRFTSRPLHCDRNSPHNTAQKACWDPEPILTWWQRETCLPPMGIKQPLKTICTAKCEGMPVHAIQAHGGVAVQLHISTIWTRRKKPLLYTEVVSWVVLIANATSVKRRIFHTPGRNCIMIPWLSCPQPSHHNDDYPSFNTY